MTDSDAALNRTDVNSVILALSEDYYRKHFDPKIQVLESGCHLWIGEIGSEGYGAFSIPKGNGKYFRALSHRIAWMRKRGPIPEGKQLDHLCRNRPCLNLLHLEPVTVKENVLRGVGLCALNIKKTHCIRGHEFSQTNTRISKSGGRYCRTCAREKTFIRYYKLKALAADRALGGGGK